MNSLQLTAYDVTLWREKRLTTAHLCYKYQLEPSTFYRQAQRLEPAKLKTTIQAGPIPHSRWTEERRDSLRAELLAAVPHSPDNNLKSVLAKWDLRSLSHALQTLKVKNLSQLRGQSIESVQVLRTLKLRVCNNVLYPVHGGRRKEALQIYLDSEELEMVYQHPKCFIRNNLERVRPLVAKQLSRETRKSEAKKERP